MTQSPDASPQSDKPRTHTVEELCQRFQQAFQDGKRVRIEDILKKVQSLDSGRLLRGLIIVEVTYRRRQGESPQAAEYHSRFPDHPAVVDDTFNMLGKSSRAREEPPRQTSANGIPPVKQAKAPPGDDDFPIEVVEEGDRHRRPAPSSAQKPPARKDQFDLEIVEVPAKPGAKQPATSGSRPGGRGNAPLRKPAPKDSLDDILSQMQPLKPRVKAVRDTDDDEEQEDRPKVKKVRKKKKKQKASSEGAGNAMEFAIPLGLLIVSAIVNLAFAAVFVPVGVPMWIYVLVKVGYILITTAVTTVALFAAAAILDTQYGYFGTGLIKIGAICLTQTWIGELGLHLPGAALIEVGAWVATFTMFMVFFQLSLFERWLPCPSSASHTVSRMRFCSSP
ncbi:MAG: hypothetical protein U0903_04145 [Planctomycetales bacterium]